MSSDSERDGDVCSGSGYQVGGQSALWELKTIQYLLFFKGDINEGINFTGMTRVDRTVLPNKLAEEGVF